MKAGAASPPNGKARPSRLVRTVYVARAYGFAYCFLALGTLCWERGAGATAACGARA